MPILAAVPPHATFLFLDRRSGVEAYEVLGELAGLGPDVIWGLGPAFLASMGRTLEGVRPFPVCEGAAVPIPRTPADVVIRIHGDDPGEVLHRERAILAHLSTVEVVDSVHGFQHGESRDLTGYEDGTENPVGDAAVEVAFRAGGGDGIAGSSVLAIQRWVHDLDHFEAHTQAERDAMIGRDQHTNEELDDAPASAHVKRTAQEDFDPEAFLVRRSMPWRDHRGQGLVFVSFSATLDPFEAQLHRMVGLEDGTVDALFRFTRPVTGAVFWCPPHLDGAVDLRALLEA